MGLLDGRAVLVTGGSRGIGRAIVRRLARDGAAVVFTFNENRAAADEVAAAVAADGGRAVALRADAGQTKDVEYMVDEAGRLLGGLDVLVNNAATMVAMAMSDVTESVYDRVMAVNAKGPFFAIQRAARILRDGGRIINISTLNTVLPVPGAAMYAASKAALELFTMIAARELGGRGITVNAISPGFTDTDMLRAANPTEVLDAMLPYTALGRLGQPEDIANVAAFLAGPDSGWITGQNLRVSGGAVL